MKVTVLDKNPHSLAWAVAGLSSPDLVVSTSSDSDKVLAGLRSELPDVVVVGSSLGHFGGFGVCRDIKRRSSMGELPPIGVVLVLEREADRWQAAQAGCDAAIVVGGDSGDLDAIVRGLANAPS